MKCLGTAIIACASMALNCYGEIVYENLTNFPLGESIISGASETGYTYVLGGTGRVFESLTVVYTGFDLSGNESLTLSLYGLDSPYPGPLLLQRTVPIVEGHGQEITISDSSVGLLPDRVVFAFQFNNTQAGHAGLRESYPPSVGYVLGHWFHDGGTWSGDKLFTIYYMHGHPPLPGVRITVPDSGAGLTECFVATVIGLGWAHSRQPGGSKRWC